VVGQNANRTKCQLDKMLRVGSESFSCAQFYTSFLFASHLIAEKPVQSLAFHSESHALPVTDSEPRYLPHQNSYHSWNNQEVDSFDTQVIRENITGEHCQTISDQLFMVLL